MTRKQFVALAAVVARTIEPGERLRLAREIGEVCAATNPGFKWGRWWDACGVKL